MTFWLTWKSDIADGAIFTALIVVIVRVFG